VNKAVVQLIVRGRRVVTEEGIRPATVVVAGGRIVAVRDGADGPLPAGTRRRAVVEAGDALLMPGVVDAHVHVNEPGHSDWEGFETAGRAAAAGGVTTLIDMPLNSLPVVTEPSAVAAKRARRRACRVDVGLWGGLVPANAGRLTPLIDAGVLGVKCFLVDSGLAAFPAVGASELRLAMPVLAARGLPLLAHAESPSVIAQAPRPATSRRYRDWSASRPPAAEAEAIALLATLAATTGCRVHVVHVASVEALAVLRAARQRGVKITGETCPHYLNFTDAEIEDGATVFKCAPPIRGQRHRAALWQGLRTGDLDYVASDHSPCPPLLKRPESGDFMAAWGGIAGLQLLLPATWTGARQRGLGLARLADWLCRRPAEVAGLGSVKGRIAPGYDADLVLWQPERRWLVRPADLHHRHPRSPYIGRLFAGVVEQTWVRGRSVYAHGRFADEAHGRWLCRPPPAACRRSRERMAP